MRSSLRVAVAALSMLAVRCSSFAADAAVDSAALRCQRAVASGGAAFLARQLSELGRCVAVAAACVETGARDGGCRVEARIRCERAIARSDRRADGLAGKIAARCGDVPRDLLLGDAGLGFAALAPVCPALGSAEAKATVLGACVASAVRCRGESLVGTSAPRAGELLRVVGNAGRETRACLPDHGGGGDGVRDGATASAIVRCTRTLVRASARLALRTVANVGACVRAADVCRTLTGGAAACVAEARAACAAAFGRAAAAEGAFRRAVAARCGSSQVDFRPLASASGAGLDALADVCPAVGIDALGDAADVAECVGRRTICETRALVREATPRIDALLGLVGAEVDRAYCRPPRPSATPTPTAPTPSATVTGPTRTARPGETPTPTPSATRTPTPRPTATPVCGNGVLEDGEECDGKDFGEDTCEDLCFESAPNGVLACTRRCTIDFAGCRGVDCEAP